MQQYKKWRKILGSFGIFRALMDGWKTDLAATNFQRNIFWLTHDLTFEDNRLLAWLGSPITDCSQFVHLRAPEPAAACILQLLLRERHCWDTPGSRAEQILYSQVSHPQCPFCHHTGLELALNWLYNTSTKSSSGSSSEMFYCFLLQHPRTICVDKSRALFEMASMAMKLSRIDFREVSAHEYDGVREPRPLLYCKLVLVLCFWHGPMKENKDVVRYLDKLWQIHKLGNFLIFSVSPHCALSSLLSILRCCKDRRFSTVSSCPPIFIRFLLGSLPGFVGRDDGKATWMTLIYFDARRFERSTWQLEACISRIPEDWTLGKCSGEESDTGALSKYRQVAMTEGKSKSMALVCSKYVWTIANEVGVLHW